MPAIRVTGIGKRYVLGGETPGSLSFREALAERIQRPLRSPPPPRELWALRDLSFEVACGEVVGIVGANGAGKSTLLKILSRVTEPTHGRVVIRGRVASLLELGTGFHPELTGRENIYLNGALLGMARCDILQRFDEIVQFAEVERFLDVPVKRYSTGMYLRLAFAVAAHLEPEVLLVDEALAVGDAAFQKRCLGRMGQVAGEGRTVLFVSHNLAAIRGLCRRTLWLGDGRLQADGPTDQVLSAYQCVNASAISERYWKDPENAPGNERVRLRVARVRPGTDAPGPLTVRHPFSLEFEYWSRQPGTPLSLSVLVRTGEGQAVFNSVSFLEEAPGAHAPAGCFRSICHIPGDLLNEGRYCVDLLFLEERNRGLFRYPEVLSFEIHDDPEWREGWYGPWPGIVRPRLHWITEQADAAPRN